MKTWSLGTKILIALGVVLIVVVGLSLLKRGTPTSILTPTKTVDTTDTVLAQPTDKETVVTGTLNCLPFKNGEAVTDDNCVMGLFGDDGSKYALDTLNLTILSKELTPVDHVRIVGTLQAPNNAVNENAFDIAGVISVRALQKDPSAK